MSESTRAVASDSTWLYEVVNDVLADSDQGACWCMLVYEGV